MKKYILWVLLSAFFSSPVFAGWFEDLQKEIGERDYRKAMARCAKKMSDHLGQEQDDLATLQTYLMVLQEGLQEAADEGFSKELYAVLGRVGEFTARLSRGRPSDFQSRQKEDDFLLAQRLQAEEERKSRAYEGASAAVKTPARMCTQFLEHSRRIDIARRLNPITLGVEERIRTNTDVHVLDGFVVGNLPALLVIGDELNAGSPDLPLDEIQRRISSFFEKACREKGLKIEYEDLGKVVPLTPAEFNQDVARFFDVDLKHERAEVHHLISYVWTFAHTLFEETGDFQQLANLCVAIIENYKTGGGCMPGRINRMFRAYTLMLEETGQFRSVK